MPSRHPRRRPAPLRRRRGLGAFLGALVVTAGAVAAPIVISRAQNHAAATSSGTAGSAPPPTLALRRVRAGDGLDDLELPSAPPAAPAAPASQLPAIPGPADPRLAAIPPLPALPAAAGPGVVNVPVLMYHFIRVDTDQSDPVGWRLSISPSDLALQLGLLRRERYTAVSLGAVVAAATGGPPLPARPVVLTFDDGYSDFATRAAPLVAAAGFTATSFVVSGFVGRPGFMTAAQIRRVAASGMTIGAHTVHHADLTLISPAAAWAEIDGSRLALQRLSGQAVTDFAYPSGQFDEEAVALVEQAGFHDAVTTVEGLTQQGAARFVLSRIRVSNGEPLLTFAGRLVGRTLTAVAARSSPPPARPPARPGPRPPVSTRTPGAHGVRPS